jgi:hypothetical protein
MIAAGKGDAQPVFGKNGLAAMFTSVDDLGYGIGVALAGDGRQRIAGRGRRARRARSTLPFAGKRAMAGVNNPCIASAKGSCGPVVSHARLTVRRVALGW